MVLCSWRDLSQGSKSSRLVGGRRTDMETIVPNNPYAIFSSRKIRCPTSSTTSRKERALDPKKEKVAMSNREPPRATPSRVIGLGVEPPSLSRLGLCSKLPLPLSRRCR
ncbi:hypothetical protein TRIUR3_24145 [Triticum urartu]|uniref:Uncharacterized protein n=1 Tax=Triticum urartu TaxID=4572 RepID=M7ZCH9_TRIUA|nr:hypothetical protein TRIUR3_24145 [Triticum urartu]